MPAMRANAVRDRKQRWECDTRDPDPPAPDQPLLCAACEGKESIDHMLCDLYARTWDLREDGEELEKTLERERETIGDLLRRLAELESKIG